MGFSSIDRILDRDLIVQDVRRDQPDAFGDAHLIAVRHPLVLHGLLDADRIDDQRIAFPASDRTAVISRWHVIDLHLRLVDDRSGALR